MLEPAKAITDFVLAAVCIVLGVCLYKYAGEDENKMPVAWWGMGFLHLACAAIVGGALHGFISPLLTHQRMAAWKVIMLCIGTTNFFFLWAMIMSVFGREWRRRLWPFAITSVVVYALWIFSAYSFGVVVLYYLFTTFMIPALSFNLPGSIKAQCGSYVIVGILMGLSGTLVYQVGWAHPTNQWLNNSVFCHVIQAVAMVPLYFGGKNLRRNGS